MIIQATLNKCDGNPCPTCYQPNDCSSCECLQDMKDLSCFECASKFDNPVGQSNCLQNCKTPTQEEFAAATGTLSPEDAEKSIKKIIAIALILLAAILAIYIVTQ